MTQFDMSWAEVPQYRSRVIPSYLYVQYNDDDDLQAFVESYNTLAQQITTWFAEIGLPVYTGDLIAGDLLDWVAQGLYGQTRPVLPAGVSRDLGPYNSFMFNALPYNGRITISPEEYYATTDDIFKRCMTWNFYKGDGRTFSVRWLKRRVMRFLTGANGTDPGVDNTYQISVTFGPSNDVTIRLVAGLREITAGAIYNRAGFNTQPFNGLRTVYTAYAPLLDGEIFKSAVDAGVLQMPFQFTWTVVIA